MTWRWCSHIMDLRVRFRGRASLRLLFFSC